MKKLKYIILGVILSSLLVSSFSFSQEEKVIFCETYTLHELISILDSDEKLFTLVEKNASDPESSKIGTCQKADLDAIWNYIQSQAFQSKVPEDLLIAPGIENADQMIPLFAVRKSTSNNVFPEKQDLEEVSIRANEQADNYELYISFSNSGADKWASMTRQNKGRDIAILFQGRVIAAPRVREEIKHGKCVISGKFTESEIHSLKAAIEN